MGVLYTDFIDSYFYLLANCYYVQ